MKKALQPASVICHPRSFMGMLGGHPKIMAEMDNWKYDAGSDQELRELLEILLQVPQSIIDISGQSRTGYKHKFVQGITSQ